MRRSVLILTGILLAVTLTVASAQTASVASASDRKVAARVTPVYPELAKKMHIHGAVRVEAIVRPNGTVKSTRVLGGNPVLVESAQDAVSKWKFEPGQSETTEVVQLAFESQ
jgi:TonB family protein